MEKPQEIPTDTDTTDNNLSIIRDDVLHVEELGCGVSVGGRPNEKQEWSFTLYDLDGQGRVTKEEVAQLLKSLYDAVGSSISLPQAGTKSLKLHLTVSPDHSKRADDTHCPTKIDNQRDLNCKECHSQKDKMSCEKDINTKLNNGTFANKLGFKDVGPLRVDLPNNLSKADKEEVHRTVKKLSPTEQRQLAELVEINMQKNQERRSRHLDGRGHHNGKHKHPSLRLSHVLENPDRRSYYSDLAGIENPSTLAAMPLSPDRVDNHAVTAQPKLRTKRSSAHKRTSDKVVSQAIRDSVQPDCVTRKGDHKHSSPIRDVSKSQNAGNALTHKGHSAKSKAVISMSPTRHDVLSPHRYCCTKSSSPRKEHTLTTAAHPDDHTDKSKSREQATEQNGGPSADKPDSHKHRRHKQKEKNHVRAMLQVAQWIEKEHVSPSESVEDVSADKFEHHHFHEHHHHHHYHYYHQT